jgi:endonuclease VIII
VPEWDTIFRAAQTLHRVFAGRVVTGFSSVLPYLNRVAEDRPLAGRTIESVVARGKHLLIAFSGNLILHTHMRMNGSWHTYPAGARWQRPAADMRVLVGTGDAVAVGFNVPIAELLTAQQLARHEELQALGPDLLSDAGGVEGRSAQTFDRDEVMRRMRAHDRDAIGDVLLNQRTIAGIGNVLKSEILFIAGLDPFTPVRGLTDADLHRVIDAARDLLVANVLEPPQTLHRSIGRRTTRSMDPNAKLWVYSRGGKPCRRCGTQIQSRKTGVDARLTYWCPRCQPPSSSPSLAR